ncbi:MAG TPA: hypothetical protein VNV82_12235 [Bryobacteraceae bacterium]|nr:hypothetical protein [Bryobacteraceae bacterium]
MRATALSCGIGILACAALAADTHDDVIDLFTSMAAALSEINIPQFMDAFDKDMPDYGNLKTGVTAMVRQADVTSSIEPLSDEGDDTKRTVDLDWYLEIKSVLPDGPVVRRREVVHCELRREKKHWKIVALKPIEFFGAAKLDQ